MIFWTVVYIIAVVLQLIDANYLGHYASSQYHFIVIMASLIFLEDLKADIDEFLNDLFRWIMLALTWATSSVGIGLLFWNITSDASFEHSYPKRPVAVVYCVVFAWPLIYSAVLKFMYGQRSPPQPIEPKPQPVSESQI